MQYYPPFAPGFIRWELDLPLASVPRLGYRLFESLLNRCYIYMRALVGRNDTRALLVVTKLPAFTICRLNEVLIPVEAPTA